MRTLEKIEKKSVQHIQAIFEFFIIHQNVANLPSHFSLNIAHQIFELWPADIIDHQNHIGFAFRIIEKYSAYECQFDIAYHFHFLQTATLRINIGFYEQPFDLSARATRFD